MARIFRKWVRVAVISVCVGLGLFAAYTALVMALIPDPGPAIDRVEDKFRSLDTPEGRRALKEAVEGPRQRVRGTPTATVTPVPVE